MLIARSTLPISKWKTEDKTTTTKWKHSLTVFELICFDDRNCCSLWAMECLAMIFPWIEILIISLIAEFYWTSNKNLRSTIIHNPPQSSSRVDCFQPLVSYILRISFFYQGWNEHLYFVLWIALVLCIHLNYSRFELLRIEHF